MHGQVQKERRARRKGDGNKTDPRGTEPGDEPDGEMDDFQDLQLGSTTPVVRCDSRFTPNSSHLTIFLQDMDRPFML
jgi:hypothetical protein